MAWSLGDIPVSDALNKIQEAASKGLLAEIMRAYIEYLAKTKEADHTRTLKDTYDKYRNEAHGALVGAHGRLAGAAAWLWIGLKNLLNCFRAYGAITQSQVDSCWEQGKKKPFWRM